MPSYEKNAASGLWSCRFREMGEDNTIHQKRLSGFKTKREAQFAYEDYIKAEEQRKAALNASPNERITVDELTRAYLAYQKTRTRESSYYTEKSKAEKRVIPFFVGIKIANATPVLIQKWMETLGGISFDYRLGLYRFLKAVCAYGVDYYETADFMRKIKPPRNTERKEEMKVWEPRDLFLAMEQEQDPVYRMFYIFLYFTGCRRGEGLALQWNDIDLIAKTVRINKSLTVKTEEQYAITATKNQSSVRTIPLPDILVNELIKYRDTVQGDYVFGGDRPILTEAIRRHLHSDAKKAGVQDIRIHDLRHSHASLLISRGVPITAISKRLGHSSVQQTLQTYSHMMPTDEIVLMNALNSVQF